MDTLFRVLVQNSADAVAMLNADGSIRFASESSVRLLGYPGMSDGAFARIAVTDTGTGIPTGQPALALR